MPADIRALAQEAVELAGKATLMIDGAREVFGDIWLRFRDTTRQAPASCCDLFIHAGTHYATIAKALLEALDERDEARRRFHARDAEADRLAQRISRAFDEVNAPAMGAEPHERIQMLADDRDHWRTEATRRADDAHAAVMDRLEMERGMLRACADRDALLADLPHALGRCGCVKVRIPAKSDFDGMKSEWWYLRWPEAHTAAIARLEARIK